MSLPSPYPSRDTARGAAVFAAQVLVGLPYRWGGDVPSAGGLDCSGLYQYALKSAGVMPWDRAFPHVYDRTAAELWADLSPVDDGCHPLPGDAAFYGVRDSKGVLHVRHIVMVVRVEPDGVPYEVIGASSGLGRVAVFRSDAERPAHLYRPDFLGFRRCPVHT